MIVIGLLGWYIYNSAQRAPEFYQTAITLPPDELENEGKQFEARVFELQNSAYEKGRWQATFTELQVNGWLSSDLPEKFPDVIPRGMSNPRIAIENDVIKLAFKFNSRRLKGYVVAKCDAFCCEEQNQVAIRIRSAKAGVAPLPISVCADSITRALRKTGTTTTWTEIDGDPVALITLPDDLTNNEDRRIELESIQLQDGKMVLSGVTVAIELQK